MGIILTFFFIVFFVDLVRDAIKYGEKKNETYKIFIVLDVIVLLIILLCGYLCL